MWFHDSCCALILAIGANAVFRRVRSGNSVTQFVLTGAVIGVALIAWLISNLGFTVEMLAGLLLYGFGCELYIFVFTLVVSSLSARTILRLRGQDLPAEAVHNFYDNAVLVSTRLDRLEQAGFVQRSGDRYELTPKGHLTVHAFNGFRKVLRHA